MADWDLTEFSKPESKNALKSPKKRRKWSRKKQPLLSAKIDVYLTPENKAKIVQIAERKKISHSQVVGQIIDAYLELT